MLQSGGAFLQYHSKWQWQPVFRRRNKCMVKFHQFQYSSLYLPVGKPDQGELNVDVPALVSKIDEINAHWKAKDEGTAEIPVDLHEKEREAGAQLEGLLNSDISAESNPELLASVKASIGSFDNADILKVLLRVEAKLENREPRFKFKRSTTSLLEQLNHATKISIDSTGKLVDLSNILVKIKQIESRGIPGGVYKDVPLKPEDFKETRLKAIRGENKNE